MKHILTTLVLGGMLASLPMAANAQIDQCPWCKSTGIIPNGSPSFRYPEEVYAQQPAIPDPRIAPLPPAKYDHPYRGGQVIITRWHDYAMVRSMCTDGIGATACSYRVQDSKTGEQISCLIMLGPAAWNDDRALRHEIGHCNGWSDQHEGAR